MTPQDASATFSPSVRALSRHAGLRLRNGERLLFIGDSITECMRETVEPPLGGGYVQLVHCLLSACHPQLEVEYLNRGVPGNTILDLERRWDHDVIAEAPDWLFVMIGVNDLLFRHLPDRLERAVSNQQYRDAYMRLAERTRAELDCRVVLLEPTPPEEALGATSRQMMQELVDIVGDVARAFDFDVVHTFDSFCEVMDRAPTKGWLIDVPHPNLRGQTVLAVSVFEYLVGAA